MTRLLHVDNQQVSTVLEAVQQLWLKSPAIYNQHQGFQVGHLVMKILECPE